MSVLREYQQTMRREIKRREAEIAFLKQRLESAEGVLERIAKGPNTAAAIAARTFIQEQEKQNG